jgi:heptose I phosphotransferase
LHEAIPALAQRLEPPAFAAWKRSLIAAMARDTATLHGAGLFHKDLYLCHFFVDPERSVAQGSAIRPTLIDLHRLGQHRRWPDRWRRKDLAQLLYSTRGVAGIDDRDRLRFWKHYRRHLGLLRPRRQARMIARKAARYLAHITKSQGGSWGVTGGDAVVGLSEAPPTQPSPTRGLLVEVFRWGVLFN